MKADSNNIPGMSQVTKIELICRSSISFPNYLFITGLVDLFEHFLVYNLF